ncbi:MAG: TonB-dependent receptor, partial [Candidatus Marinimicrobia bacterium]|nr:TonB-dependent receptor [Candidatus Neomarinimicrobiota bacterium]
FKGSIDYRTDGFSAPEDGKKMLNTYNYGHQTGILTLSGPLLTKKATFFLAGEYRNRDDRQIRFSKGFEFTDLIDMNPSNTIHDSIPEFSYPDGFTPKQNDTHYTLNGTVTLDLPIRLTFGGMYNYRKYDRETQPMLDILNDRKQYDETSNLLLTAKATKMFSSKSILEVKVSSYNYSQERNDSWFGNEWGKWYDSTEVYSYSEKHFDDPVVYRHGWRPKYEYHIHGFPCERNGDPTTWYRTSKQNYLGASADYQTQIGQHHDVRTGLDYRGYTIRYFDISPGIMQYTAEDGTYGFETYGSMEGVPANKWMQNGGVDTYGYDIYGNEISEKTEYKDDDGTVIAYADAPRKPMQFATYFMDKIEYNDLIVNAGLRIDYFDSDDKELIDPADPEVDQGTQMISANAWEDVDPFIEISPRLGFSFPTDEKTVFYLQFGKFVQMPSLDNMYFSNYQMARQIVWQGYYFINPVGFGLDPIRTTSYEIGLRRQIAENVAFDVCAFYKNVKGLVETIKQLPSPTSAIPGYYDRFENGDFQTTKGLEFRLTLRRMNRLSGQINYTLTDAEGTASNSTSNHGALYNNTILPTTINPLDFSQTHVGSINLDYRFGKDDGGPILEQMGVNLLFNFSSGHPFTYVYVPPGGQVDPFTAGVDYMWDTRWRFAEEAVGSSTTPWTSTTDLRLDKSIDIGPIKATAYLIVNNLFNRKNVVNVYERTGNASDDGFISDPNNSATTVAGYGGQDYIDMYNAINIENGQAYWWDVGRELYGTPRQIFFGIKIAF